jgi:hypothetical protein
LTGSEEELFALKIKVRFQCSVSKINFQRAWEIGKQPITANIPFLFMLWMFPDQPSIFTLAIVWMAFSNPIFSIFSINQGILAMAFIFLFFVFCINFFSLLMFSFCEHSNRREEQPQAVAGQAPFPGPEHRRDPVGMSQAVAHGPAACRRRRLDRVLPSRGRMRCALSISSFLISQSNEVSFGGSYF